jgi:hypothetical protein
MCNKQQGLSIRQLDVLSDIAMIMEPLFIVMKGLSIQESTSLVSYWSSHLNNIRIIIFIIFLLYAFLFLFFMSSVSECYTLYIVSH